MNLFAAAPLWLVAILAGLLVAAAVQDAVQLRISNLLVIAVIGLAVACVALVGVQSAIWQNVAAFALVLVAGSIAFSRGMMGGGDIKLIAAVALWTDGSTALTLLLAIVLCGGLLALMLIGARTFAPQAASRRVAVLGRNAGIPYGIAIALGSLAVLATIRF